MSIPTFIRGYRAAAVIGAYTIAAFAAPTEDSTAAPATGASDPLIGTTGRLGASEPGAMADITRAGLGSVRLGGDVKAGDQLTSDAQGRAIAVPTPAAAGTRIIGTAEGPGGADDIIDYFAAPAVIQETA